MSYPPMLPKHAPISSYRSKGRVVTWRHGQAIQALKDIVAESGANSDEFTLHLLRIGGGLDTRSGRNRVGASNSEGRKMEIGCE